MQWYYVLNGARLGPVTQEQFDQLAQSRAITPETLVWRAGMAAWQPLGQALAQPAPDADSAICAVSGKVYPKRDMLEYNGQWISAEHKDEFFQRLREGVPQQGEMRYMGFWIRFLAWFIDWLCMIAINTVIGVVFMFLMLAVGGSESTFRENGGKTALSGAFIAILILRLIVQIAAGFGYVIFFIRRFDATPGKLAIGAKLLRSNGDKLSVCRIIGRELSRIVSAAPFLIGYMMAGWTDQKCALHDYMCDTRVIKK